VSYYSANQIDRALAQFEHSLSVDPAHTKTLLNKGIVLAFGKQDLDAASRAWEQLVAVAPNSPEAIRA
jgi:tetratricopeptide (TPR) repeat protein